MDLLFFLVVLATSVWVLVDAKKLNIKKGQAKGLANMGPWSWFVVCLVLWVIAFPYYLYKRPSLKRLNENSDQNNVLDEEEKPKGGLWGKISLGFIACIAILFLVLSLGTQGIPMCNEAHAKDMVMEAINNSPKAKTYNIEALELYEVEEQEFNEEGNSRICSATAYLNNGNKKVEYVFEQTEDGTVWVEVTGF